MTKARQIWAQFSWDGITDYMGGPANYDEVARVSVLCDEYLSRWIGDRELLRREQEAHVLSINGVDGILDHIDDYDERVAVRAMCIAKERSDANQKEPKPKPDPSYVYIMRNERNGMIKIGKSKDPHQREKTLQSEEPETTMLTFTLVFNAVAAERWLHSRYDDHRVRGEWFALPDAELREARHLLSKMKVPS